MNWFSVAVEGKAPSTNRAYVLAAWALSAAAFAFPAWRASLPNNQHRDADQVGVPMPGEIWSQNANGYDDVVTVVTARNFVRDGFLRTHFLPNRKGAPLVSYFDFGHSQCLALDEDAGPPLPYRSVMGEWIDLRSVKGDCVYTHYPPLADWIFGAMALTGLESIFWFRMLAILVSCATLLLLFYWLRREVHALAALAAIGLIAISPAFFHWAAALFHISYQFLFLAGGIVSWKRFLDVRRRRWFLITFALFFLEAMVSYELVAFFAIMVAAFAALDGRDAPWRRRTGWLAAQALAPVCAFLLHLGLRVSLFGLGPTWRNVVETAAARAGQGWTAYREAVWWNRLELRLLRFDLAILALLLVLVVRYAVRGRPMRALALLATMLAGGVSFLVLFPGTTWVHSWMMYRHFLPATVLLLALVADAGLRCLGSIRSAPGRARGGRGIRPAAAVAGVALSLVPVSWSAYQSALALNREYKWQRSMNAHVDPENHGVHFLDVIHWMEDGPPFYDLTPLLAVSGRRVDFPPNVRTATMLYPGASQHLDVWWLDEVSLSSVRVLAEATALTTVATRCNLSWFDGSRFVPVDPERSEQYPFAPDVGEPPGDGYAWWSIPIRARTRAIRLSCADLPVPVWLHQVEVR